MKFAVKEAELYLTTCRTRLPFRFGIATMTVAPLGTARLVIESTDGTRCEGVAADLLVPKWFEKDSSKSIVDDVRALIGSVDATGRFLTSRRGAATVFDHWWEMYQDSVGSQPDDAADLLVRGFGVALYERAMIDAMCRASTCSFHHTIVRNLVGFDPGRVDAHLADWHVASLAEPRERVAVRHTVGLADPLTAADGGVRINDGLPETLEEDIAAYGLKFFKIKVSGDIDADVDRLVRIGDLLERKAGPDARFTLDGNEQFESIEAFRELFDRLAAATARSGLVDRLLYIEQPLPRGSTFDPARHEGIDALPPVIVDEADVNLSAFPRAVAIGYRGISIKNCKGVFRSLINRARCDTSSQSLFQSAEDLTNLPVIALQQDLTVVASLGLAHVERNGQHYFRGLDHLPAKEVESALQYHSDLYAMSDACARLRIQDGSLSIASLQCDSFGVASKIDFDARTLASEWNVEKEMQ